MRRKRTNILKIMLFTGAILVFAGFLMAVITSAFNETNLKISLLGIFIILFGIVAYLVKGASWHE